MILELSDAEGYGVSRSDVEEQCLNHLGKFTNFS